MDVLSDLGGCFWGCRARIGGGTWSYTCEHSRVLTIIAEIDNYRKSRQSENIELVISFHGYS